MFLTCPLVSLCVSPVLLSLQLLLNRRTTFHFTLWVFRILRIVVNNQKILILLFLESFDHFELRILAINKKNYKQLVSITPLGLIN